MIWTNKILSATHFYHKYRCQYFNCYYGDDKWVYPSNPNSSSLVLLDLHTKFLRSDCKIVLDLYFDYKNLDEFKSIYINPYFFKL